VCVVRYLFAFWKIVLCGRAPRGIHPSSLATFDTA
jgi:hypothetical protein